MISSFLGLQTSLRGLLAQQQALDVAAHNVANANTVGYTRQEATLGAADPLHLTAGATQNGAGAFLGQGVDVTAYRRLRDSFLDLQVRAQSMALGDATTSAEALDRVQSAVGEPSTTGINALMGKFYTAWSDLANHPESDSSKQAVASAAQTLGDAFGKLAGDITSAANDANAEFTSITGATGPIKAAATSLAQLNKAIDTAIDAGQSPNDLLDRRDQILDDLSQYGQVSVSQLGNGRIQVMLGNQSVVNDTTSDWQTPPPAGFAPGGGQLGALKTLATTTSRATWPRSTPSPRRCTTTSTPPTARPSSRGDTAATLGTGIPAASTITAGSGGADGLQRHRHGRRRAARHQRRDQPVRRARAPDRLGRVRRGERPVDRPGRRRRRPGPPPERLGRLARRGDGQHAALPARLPGLGPRDVDDRRHARHAHQPRRTGRAVAMRVTSDMSQRHVLSDLRRVQERLPAAQGQVSSGKRIEKPSDDPLGAERAMRLNDQLESTGAYRTAVNESRSWLDATDSALSSLNDVVQHVRELTLQAANGSTSDAGRQSIKAQIDQLTEEAKNTLNSAYDGRYIFSGTATGTRPYSAATGDAYQGDSAAVVRQIGPGVSVQVNVTGDDVALRAAAHPAHALGPPGVQRHRVAGHDRPEGDRRGLRQPDRQARRRRRHDQPRGRGRHAPRRHDGHHDGVPVQDPGRRPSPGAHRPDRAADGAPGRSAWWRRPDPAVAHGLPAMNTTTPGGNMAVVTLHSSRFGVLEIPEEAVIEFPSGLIGLGGTRYALLARSDDSAFVWLHSLDDHELAVPVTNPFRFFNDFEVELSDEEAARIGLTEADDPTVYVTVRATDSLEGFSANLYAPILISGGRGHQVINQTADAPVRAPLFQRPATEERVHAA